MNVEVRMCSGMPRNIEALFPDAKPNPTPSILSPMNVLPLASAALNQKSTNFLKTQKALDTLNPLAEIFFPGSTFGQGGPGAP